MSECDAPGVYREREKLAAVKLAKRLGASQAARQLGIPVGTVSCWRFLSDQARARGEAWPKSGAARERQLGPSAARATQEQSQARSRKSSTALTRRAAVAGGGRDTAAEPARACGSPYAPPPAGDLVFEPQGGAGSVAPGAMAEGAMAEGGPLFVPLQVVAPAASGEGVWASQDVRGEEVALEVLVRGGRRIRVPRGFDGETLCRLVRALEEVDRC